MRAAAESRRAKSPLHPKIHGGLLCRRDRPEHEDRSGDAAVAQYDGLFQRVRANPLREWFGRQRGLYQTVAVGVALNDERRVFVSDQIAQDARIVSDRGERDAKAADHAPYGLLVCMSRTT